MPGAQPNGTSTWRRLFGHRRSARLRLLLAGLGAVSGLLGGVGAEIILTQGGRVEGGLALGLPIGGVLLGVILGLVALPKRVNRALSIVVTLITLAIAMFAFLPPAAAQSDGCGVEVSIGDQTHDLLRTSEEAPLTVDLGAADTISFVATAPGIEHGTVEVAALSITPLGFLVDERETVLYFAEIEGGSASATLRIERSLPTGFSLTGPGSFESPLMPLGRVELGILVFDLAADPDTPVCDEVAWVRFVARPISNWAGIAGVLLSLLGFAGFAGLFAIQNRIAPSLGELPIPIEEPPPAETPVTPEEPETRDPDRWPVKPAGSGPFIPARGGHAPYVESRVLDPMGNVVGFDQPLLQGGDYRLEITLRPDLAGEEEAAEDSTEVRIHGWSDGIEVTPTLTIGLGGTPLAFDIPIRPARSGRYDVALDVTAKGHLLQTERISVAVAGAGGPAPEGVAQTTRTVYSGSDLSTTDLRERRPRALLIILESDTDGTVDARVRDTNGNLIARFDSVLQPAALVGAASSARGRLQGELEAGAGYRPKLTRGELERSMIPLVKAGRQLYRAVFPRRAVDDDSVGAVESHVTSDATIQVVQTKAGLGYSTLPWNLVYDHAFLPHTERNHLCPQFPHDVDECPHREDPEVVCPTGFWGYRAIIEEPWVAVDETVLPPPVAMAGEEVGFGYFDTALSDSDRQAHRFGALGMQRIEDLDELLDAFRSQSAHMSLLYFYAHHARDPDVGTPGVAIGGELLSSFTFDALEAELERRPLVIINGCGSGDYSVTDPLSLLEEFRRLGAAGTVTTECTVWDPLAGALGERMIAALARGEEIGSILLTMRRDLAAQDNNMLGFVYRLHALSETTARLAPTPTETIAIDLRAAESAALSTDEPQP